jgi:hypothetical protein
MLTTKLASYYAHPHHFATVIATNGPAQNDGTAVLGDATITPAVAKLNSDTLPTSDTSNHADYVLPALGLLLACLILAVSEHDRFFHRNI